MNHLREMNFLVVVSVPLTTESWLLLRGEPRKDADDCRKMLSPPEVQASGAGLCPPLAFSESDLRAHLMWHNRIQKENLSPWFTASLLRAQIPGDHPVAATVAPGPCCSEASSWLVFKLLFLNSVAHTVP